MSSTLSSRRICVGLAVLACSAMAAGTAPAGGKERGRPIEFSAPKSDEVTTNLHQLTSKKDGLKQLEEELYQPLQSFAPKSSLDGVAARPYRPPARSAIDNKRVKELLDRRKNWVFMDPNNIMGAPTLEEMLKAPELGPDGKEQKELSAMANFYQRLSKQRNGAEAQSPAVNNELFGQNPRKDRREDTSVREDALMPGAVKQSADMLKKLFQTAGAEDSFSPPARHGTFEDMFGLAVKEPSAEDLKAHKKFLSDYQAEVDPDWKPFAPGTPEDPFASFTAPPTAPATKPVVSLPTVASPALHTAMDAQADIVNPRLGPTLLPDLNAKALGQPRMADAFPKVEAPRVASPTPSFEAPKRSFR
jgi:hypothetical protein